MKRHLANYYPQVFLSFWGCYLKTVIRSMIDLNTRILKHCKRNAAFSEKEKRCYSQGEGSTCGGHHLPSPAPLPKEATGVGRRQHALGCRLHFQPHHSWAWAWAWGLPWGHSFRGLPLKLAPDPEDAAMVIAGEQRAYQRQ